ncbi:hypothetical protein K443DRAFT_131974 [Laccaria amethystina LaAM-08-1]|uniref:Extracellular metalloproteinase n=1 Tax=Laccaria amethystina LaAM-08-1 TaxID=1095629 RepID=A0A0C9Y248_9AGAR|nr:hypothetical protein K443DRAFT_131974 [Laccaria amethystina LaAM-08-1]
MLAYRPQGGAGNDRVLISLQDLSGANNATFAPPLCGQSGQCRMYIWTMTTPNRDGSLENEIIVHEMTHGIANRMTGGGTGRCLQTTEVGGMGEGWPDAFAEFQESATITDYIMGAYVYKPAGIRNYPYTTNPYSSIASLNEVHIRFSTTAATNPDGPGGNIVFLHLFIDALALQPCDPTFVSAREAWIQTDKNRYNGANKFLLWEAFASLGLGVNANNYRGFYLYYRSAQHVEALIHT